MGEKSGPFCNKEKILLAQLVRENNIVENKKTDAATLQQKNQGWEYITSAYNSQPDVNSPSPSPSMQLRKLWTNLKQRKCKETTALRHSMLATGGGPPKKPAYDPVLELVDDAAPYLDISIDCPWDSTQLFETEQAKARKELNDAAANVLPDMPVVVEYAEAIAFPAQSGNSLSIISGAPIPEAAEGDDAADNVDCTETLPTFSVSTPVRKNLSTQGNAPVCVLNEKKAREKRINDAIHQQQELHNIKMQIAEEELLRARAEAKLARLKLEEFEKRILSGGGSVHS